MFVFVESNVLTKIRCPNGEPANTSRKKEKVAVIHYTHKISHHLQNVAAPVGVKVVFPAPGKLSQL